MGRIRIMDNFQILKPVSSSLAGIELILRMRRKAGKGHAIEIGWTQSINFPDLNY